MNKKGFDRFFRIPIKNNREAEALLKLLYGTVFHERSTIHWIEEFKVET